MLALQDLHIPWIGNVSIKFKKQITSAMKRCLFSVEPCVIFNTRQLLPATKKDVLSSHHHSNVIYQFVCHCDSQYVGRTPQRLKEQIKQHVPKSIANPPASHNHQSLSRSCKANIRPQQFHKSFIGQHLLDNAQCALHYNNKKFSILARGRFSFHLSVLETTFIKSRRCRRRRLKGIHSRSDTNRTGVEGLSFYYPRLLHCLDQMLAVVLLSHHRVSSSKTVRPRAP